MIVKQVVDEDFVNYKKPSMFIAFPRCTWKCEKECGERVCQNGALATAPDIEIDANKLVERYLSNDITSAVVLGGLEPFDSPQDLLDFITAFRAKSEDDIVIYTGYIRKELCGIKLGDNTKPEYENQSILKILTGFPNIIIKFGRYFPNQKPHYNDVLGVMLASNNQYAEQIS